MSHAPVPGATACWSLGFSLTVRKTGEQRGGCLKCSRGGLAGREELGCDPGGEAGRDGEPGYWGRGVLHA